MTETTDRNFLGIPVKGDINRGATRVPQRALTEFGLLLTGVLSDSTIVSLGWRQYTPYFNDGDPCIFRVGTPWVRTTDTAQTDSEDYEDDDEDDDDAEHWVMFRTIGHIDYRSKEYVGPDRERYDRVAALTDAIERGEFDDVLLDAFGDHAIVKITRDGITVDFYDHD